MAGVSAPRSPSEGQSVRMQVSTFTLSREKKTRTPPSGHPGQESRKRDGMMGLG